MAMFIDPDGSGSSRMRVSDTSAVIATVRGGGGFGDDRKVGHRLAAVTMVVVVQRDDFVLGGPSRARRTTVALWTDSWVVVIDHD